MVMFMTKLVETAIYRKKSDETINKDTPKCKKIENNSDKVNQCTYTNKYIYVYMERTCISSQEKGIINNQYN